MLTADGQQILAGLAETRKFFEQVSLLIRTAEDCLRDAGWDNLFGNKCAEITGHLYKPRSWMPTDIYRFFVASEDSEENRDLILFVGVLLDREGAWSGFKEPWITCGLYQFSPDVNVREFRYWDWVRAHLDDQHDPDGDFYVYVCSPEEQQEYDGLMYEAIMALPLVAITSAEDLKQKFIDPLLQEISRVPNRDEE